MSTIAHEEFIPHLTLTVGAPESILKSKGFLYAQNSSDNIVMNICLVMVCTHGFLYAHLLV